MANYLIFLFKTYILRLIIPSAADNTTHFTGEFRSQYLIGGVRTGMTDGNIRLDATALSLVAFQRFLESGADGRE